jgi:hypothetical protein
MAVEAVPLSPSSPFQEWQRALVALRSAEARGDSHPEIVRLSAEVIRAHNAMTVGRLQAGWQAPDDVLKQLAVDAALLAEDDDSGYAGLPASKQ